MNTSLLKTTGKSLLMAAATWMAVMAGPAVADTPGYHPHYDHALSDLRQAHSILSSFQYWDRSDQAWSDKELRFAIRESLRAAWDDGKNTNVNFAPDVNLSQADLLRQARRLIAGARKDMQYEEDNPAAYGWRASAVDHLNRSIGYLDRALRVDHQ